MPDPINYLAGIQPVGPSLLTGFQAGVNLAQVRAERERLAQEDALKAQAVQQQQAALQAKQAEERTYQDALTRFFKLENPTAEDYSAVVANAPKELISVASERWKNLGEKKQKATLRDMGTAMSYTLNGRPDLAVGMLRDLAKAAEGAGETEEARNIGNYANMIEADPKMGVKIMGSALAILPDGKNVLENLFKVTGEGRAETEAERKQRESEAGIAKTEAETKQTEASTEKTTMENKLLEEFGRSEIIAKLGLTAAQTQNYADDTAIKRINARIADDRLALDRGNLKVREMEAKQGDRALILREKELNEAIAKRIQESETKREEKLMSRRNEMIAAAQNADTSIANIDNALAFSDDVFESAAGPISSRVPTLSQDTADLEEAIETVKSQVFLAQIPLMTGKGALSDAEGKKLDASIRSISLRQSPERLKANLEEIKRLIQKGRDGMSARFGLEAPPVDKPPPSPTTPTRQFKVIGREGG